MGRFSPGLERYRRKHRPAEPVTPEPAPVTPPKPPVLFVPLPRRALDPAPAVEIVSRPSRVQALVPTSSDAEEKLLEHFLGSRSDNTLRAYKRDLAALALFLETDRKGAIGRLLREGPAAANSIVLQWLNAMKAEEMAPATQARRLSTLRSLAKAARMVGFIDWNLEIEGPHVQSYRDVEGPTEDVVKRMLSACGAGKKGERDRLVVLLLAGFGLRRNEAVSLRLRDYDGRRLRVLGKGEKLVWLTLDDYSKEVLDRWIAARGITNPDAMILQSLRGKSLTPDGLYHVVQQIGKRAGVRVWPHAFRHSGITLGADVAKGDIRKVQAYSRHSDPKTAMIYIDRQQDFGGEVRAKVVERLFKEEEEEKDGD